MIDGLIEAGTQEALGGIRESKRQPGKAQKASRRPQEAPRTHPRGIQDPRELQKAYVS